MIRSLRPGSVRLTVVAAAAVGLVVASLPASGQVTPLAGPDWHDYGFQGEGHARVDNLDARRGRLDPTADQVALAERLGATVARWNEFGTPHVLIDHGGEGLSDAREGAAVDVARAFVADNAALFRLDAAGVASLEVLRDAPLYDATDLDAVRDGRAPANPDVAHVVLFRQRFGELAAGLDGLLTVGVARDGRVMYVTSSVTGDRALAGEQRLSAADAVRAAAADVELELGTLTEVADDTSRFTTFQSDVVTDVQRARLVAVPTPMDGVRRAFEVTLLDTSFDEHGNPTAFISFIDAENGAVLQRSNRVDHFQEEDEDDDQGTNSSVPLPQWRVFPANPPLPFSEGASEDTRVLWCWDNETDPERCEEEQRNTASRLPWDTRVPSTPTFTTDGNNATTAISEVSPFTPDTLFSRPFGGLSRSYDYAWTNAWNENACNPSTFGTVVDNRNDESAAITNLFVMHNRMHDWSYYLGFTEENYNLQQSNFGNTGPERENDPEVGQTQGGRRTPIFGRDNANQITLQDGIAPITNQYLWQPLAGAFYAPCVDGAYDMAVVAHEYTHAITNRMIAGPDGGTGDSQGQTESWSDLGFAAYFAEFGITAGEGVNPFTLGPYVTGDEVSAIRNYAMNDSPLQHGDLEYDGNGLTSPHANGEIWSAVNHDIFESLAAKYDAQFPSSDVALQQRCARGQLDAIACPGNRRWNQIQFDSFLLMPQDSTMLDSRDAMLAADLLRFDGANQDELWDAFARRGFGVSAFSLPIDRGEFPARVVFRTERIDLDPTPAYDSPRRDDEARVTFVAPSGVRADVFVGVYEARVSPLADTDPDTKDPDDTAEFVPGTYQLLVRADGFGARRFELTLSPGEQRTVQLPVQRNFASAASGATISGDGVNLDRLIDDTESTNWASLSDEPDRLDPGAEDEELSPDEEGRTVEGREVTVDLAGDEPVNVTDVQVSAALNSGCSTTPILGDCEAEEQDTGSQNRFSALRSFDILTCDSTAGVDCSQDEHFTQVFASSDDAFPGSRPRPKAPDFILRPFDVEDSRATHLRLVVRDNQCTGGPDFQGETNPDNDPAFNPDCDTLSSSPDRGVLRPPFDEVRAAELQVFGVQSPAAVQAEARAITQACPEDEVPRDSRQDDNGNVHEFAIDCMVWYEIAQGTSETEYGPVEPVSRGQMASFIARLVEESGGQLEESPDDAFDDDNGSTHELRINQLAAAGVVGGKGDRRYDPRGTVSRAQMATFLVKGYEFRSPNELVTQDDYFADDNGNTHEDNINRSAAAGFTAGRGGGYEPRADVLRDAMASFLARTLDLLVGEGTTVPKNERSSGPLGLG
jgi:extracellular elastinolytic metalloproteinase